MKITVLGCGALGQLFLSRLYQQGHDIQGWLRFPQPFCFVNVLENNGSWFKRDILANNLCHLVRSELLLVTLKAWQVSSSISALLPNLSANCIILLLHNGMGTEDELLCSDQPILAGCTTHAAWHRGDRVIHTANGITQVGPISEKAQYFSYVAEVLNQAFPDVVWLQNIAFARWKKLAVNCVINPLTALYGCLNGDIQRYSQQISEICCEVANIMELEGHNISHEDLKKHVMHVIDKTANNISSMLQDIRARRHTEIDYITGYLLRRAHHYGITLQTNIKLFTLIKQKENKYKSRINDLVNLGH